VFHSPAYPLPAEIVLQNRRFLTCHDVLPIRRPDLFQPEHVAFAAAILQSIRPDDHVICVSHATAADFCEITHHPANRVHVVHSAADRELFHQELDSERIRSVASKYGVTTPYILSVGTLEPRKNLGHVVKAFARLQNDHQARDLSLVIVGAGGWGPDIADLIAQHPGSSRHIVRTGYVPDSDLAALYSGASAFVYMSLFEGFGLPLLEAMQCGTPVVGSDIPALREVAGRAGTLLDPHDLDALADAMWRLHHNVADRAAASRASLERSRQFTWQRTAERVMQTYETALAR
jgi:glycosyltransferase involved in cell wall biosynthesis